MYLTSHFKEENTEKLHQYIRTLNFGVLVVADEAGIEANHLPFRLNAEAGPFGTLECHVSRNNPAWQCIADGGRVLVIFQGPNAYISPSWYPSKVDAGRVVPTWNYLAVHAAGPAQVIQDPVWLKEHVRRLTDQHEAGRESPWSLDDAPGDFIDRLAAGIVGIEIRIDQLIGKLKASQNQSEANRMGVKRGLAGEADFNAQAMSELIQGVTATQI